MNIWLDLMADHNNHLGQLEEYGRVVTDETATYVVQEIAKKYDPRVCPFFRTLPLSDAKSART